MLPETSIEGGRTLAEKLRTGLESTPFTFEDHVLRLTITIGVASFTADMAGFEDCIAVADDALYQGKQRGRNQVVVVEPTAAPGLSGGTLGQDALRE